MERATRQRRIILSLAGLGLLAGAGQLVFNQAVATIGQGQGKPWTLFTSGFDFWPIWLYTRQFLTGEGDLQWYGAGTSNAWPPPHEVLLSPLALLSYDAAHVVSMLLTAVLLIA